ncbi:MAG: thymidine phosphorylase, partial [Gemmatimonadales bacterium]
MVVASLIERKRDGGSLTDGEWAGFIEAFADGRIPDYQMAAMLMAVCWRGLNDAELQSVTSAMLHSGESLTFPAGALPRIDKHSTGGVGDKTSIILAPLVATCGMAIPMMAGRGLGHTGGTVDKLESIPGFRTGLTLDQVRAQIERLGVAIFCQTAEVAPVDRRLYALRDVTATIASIPLIAASIMSKKLAEGLNGLVLDVKTGSGAFMPEPAGALELARTMVAIGEGSGCTTVALITAMDRPLGRAMGNALEIEECLQALEGQGPPDLMEVTLALATEMLHLGGIA